MMFAGENTTCLRLFRSQRWLSTEIQLYSKLLKRELLRTRARGVVAAKLNNTCVCCDLVAYSYYHTTR